MARYTKSEVQDWAWETLRAQWTTLITPFTPDNAIDEEGMRRNVMAFSGFEGLDSGCLFQSARLACKKALDYPALGFPRIIVQPNL